MSQSSANEGSPIVPMASPEAIAKAIAETQKKMQSQTTSTSASYLPSEFTVPMASPEEINQVIAATQRKLKEQSMKVIYINYFYILDPYELMILNAEAIE